MTTTTFQRTGAVSIAAFLVVLCLKLNANSPSWWASRHVVDDQTEQNDFAPVNQGQVKWMALQAYMELDEDQAPAGGAGSTLSNFVYNLTLEGNYLPANVGQLKCIAQPFYDRLIELGLRTNYPWADSTSPVNDFAMANVGQLKNLFNYNPDDPDGDGIPDWWELQSFGVVIRHIAQEDPDGDGLSNFDEYCAGSIPTQSDSDRDAVNDGQEVLQQTSPVLPDSDGDELLDGGDIAVSDSDVRYLLWKEAGIAYVDHEGQRIFKGERGQHSQPTMPDSDDDGLLDGYDITITEEDERYSLWSGDGIIHTDDVEQRTFKGELSQESNPTNSDTDGDELPDGWEVTHGLDPLNPLDALVDTDMDTLINRLEYTHETSPQEPDTDGDHMPDGWEVANSMNPLDDKDQMSDADGDTFGNLYEYRYGTNPRDDGSMPAPTFYVNGASASGGDGSVRQAFRTIQSGLSAVGTSRYAIIEVADGIYTGDLEFAGSPLMLISKNGAEKCIVDCQAGGNGLDFSHGDDNRSVVAGFTIQNASSSAIHCVSSSPRIERCRLQDNMAASGAALYCEDSSPVLVNCVLARNQAQQGAGVFATGTSQPVFENCTIYDNHASALGGGIYAEETSCPSFLNCIIWSNTPDQVMGDSAHFSFCNVENSGAASSRPSWNYPLATYYHDARAQVIYHNDEIGDGGEIRSLSMRVTEASRQTMQHFTIRLKQTSLDQYDTTVWEDDSSWAMVYQGDVTISDIGWVTFDLETPYTYDGTYNLMVDISFDNGISSTDSRVEVRETGAPRALYYRTDGVYGDPLTWSGVSPTPETGSVVPLLQLVVNGTIRLIPDSNMTLEPQLTADHHLMWKSPCIDKGYTFAPMKDMEGESRTDDPDHINLISAVDVGAFEFVDTDRDGLSDLWEVRQFGDLTSQTGVDDADRDGLTNIGENYWEKDPNKPESYVELINAGLSARASHTEKSMDVYLGLNDFRRNTNCWIHGIDTTCASPFNTDHGTYKAGTLITPQHFVYARHYMATNGTRFLFVDNTNGAHWRTMVDQRVVYGDLVLGLLDTQLPSSVTPANILSEEDCTRLYSELHPTQSSFDKNQVWNCGVRGFYFNRMEMAGFGYIAKSAAGSGTAPAHPFAYGVVGGDSGNPSFLAIGSNTVPVLWLTMFASESCGPRIGMMADRILSTITSLGNSTHTNLSFLSLDDELRDYCPEPAE